MSSGVVADENHPVFRVSGGLLFPGQVRPFSLRHHRAAVEEARLGSRNPYRGPSRPALLFVVGQKQPSVAEPALADLHPVGCVAEVRTTESTQDGERVILHGQYRAALVEITQTAPFERARVTPLWPEPALTHPQRSDVEEIRECALVVAHAEGAPSEAFETIEQLEATKVAYFVAAHVAAPIDVKARWLAASLDERIGLLLAWLRAELAQLGAKPAARAERS